MTIKTIADPFTNEQTEAYAKQFGIENVSKNADDIFNDKEIEAVVIASSTDTHAKFIIESAKAGKQTFCEKPIDYDLKRVHEAIDVDTAVVTLKFKSGTIATIDNSRKAVYGYDQRVEVFGEKGVAINGNDIPNTATFADANGTVGGTAFQVMWDRYEQAFIAEMKAFAKAVANNEETPVTGEDGLYPVLMAAA